MAVCSDGSYGVEEGLICSFPVRAQSGKWEIVQGVPVNEFSRAKIDASVAELKEEKAMVGELLGGVGFASSKRAPGVVQRRRSAFPSDNKFMRTTNGSFSGCSGKRARETQPPPTSAARRKSLRQLIARQPLEGFAIFRGGFLDDLGGNRGPGGVLSQSRVSR